MTTQTSGATGVIVVRGDLDLSATTAMSQAITRWAASDARRLIVDVGEVAFIDSVGIGCLVKAHRSSENKHVRLAVSGARGQVLKVMGMTGLRPLIDLHDHLDGALAAASLTTMSEHEASEPCTTISVPHSLTSVDDARSRIRAELTAHGAAESLVLDAELILVELLANACEHGQPTRDGQVEASWCVRNGELRISVADGGHAPDLNPAPVDPRAHRGRGLQIVDYLCDNWTADTDPGTRVTAALTLT